MQRFDKGTLVLTAVALGLWVFQPVSIQSGIALIVLAALHLARLMRWKGFSTLSDPLLWVLHFAYFLLPLGALIEGIAILRPDLLTPGSAQHLWMAGCFPLMTLAVMVRATLGHTGQVLRADPMSVAIFASIIGAVLARLGAGIWPDISMPLYSLSGVLWIGAFAGFGIRYGPWSIACKGCKAMISWQVFTLVFAAFFVTHTVPVRPKVKGPPTKLFGIQRFYVGLFGIVACYAWPGHSGRWQCTLRSTVATGNLAILRRGHRHVRCLSHHRNGYRAPQPLFVRRGT